ncbi:hypothetical protein ABT010_35215 [Streptomyces sp. NPDC002668]|uniref:hypothetical protein n=1 Tax=Streptomyces sp. NPDC002668 TaxID=3154422 RepID=UPI00331AD893
MDARGPSATSECGEAAGGDRAGACVLGAVDVRDPFGDVVAEPVRQEFVGVAEVSLRPALVAEGPHGSVRGHDPG